MPAAAVPNPPWATGSWSATAWESGTWGLLFAPKVVRYPTLLEESLSRFHVEELDRSRSTDLTRQLRETSRRSKDL